MNVDLQYINLNKQNKYEKFNELKHLNNFVSSESYQRLINLEEQAKTDKKGKWNELSTEMKVRDIKYTVENPRNFVDSLKMEPQPGKF